MRDKHIAKLEARLEHLIEGAFTHFFGRKVRAQDLALRLARAMENGLHSADTTDPRPMAPDLYEIAVAPTTAEHLLRHQPNLPHTLSNYLLELATNAGYRLDAQPVISIQADADLAEDEIRVRPRHTAKDVSSTHVLQKVPSSQQAPPPQNPQIVLGNRLISLEDAIVNIGRSLENDIVLEDKHASRHHAQLRLRFGRYTLFDVQSRSGTYVNDRHVQQHTLVSGDVIRIGTTRLVYLEETNTDETTHEIRPVPPEEDHP